MPDFETLKSDLAALRHDQAVLALGLSHDLRAPLRAIDSFAYLLEQRSGQALDATSLDHLHRVREASARLGHAIARLQAYLHAGSATLNLQPVDLSLLADWCVAELRDAAPSRATQIDIAADIRAHGDERLLKIAIAELVRNAWTYAHDGAPVRIAIDAQHDDKGTTMRIRDAGIGFDPAAATRLGEPFQRLHADTHPDGSGLGLAIARRVAQRHGGSLQVEGRAGEGAVVTLFLPAPRDAA